MVFEKVKALIVKELKADESKITLETTLVDDLGADSIDAINVIMSAEEEFGVTITDEELKDIKTVGDIVKLVETKFKK